MDAFFIIAISGLASLLTFFSGFGLGTVLTPFYGLFFPIHIAVMLTAAVHGASSISKTVLLRSDIDWIFVRNFGFHSLGAAALGAWLLSNTTHSEPLYIYVLDGSVHTITWTKLSVATLLLFFVGWERTPQLRNFRFPDRWLWVGALGSGFLAGFSGHQGALRTAVMRTAGFTKERMVATGAAIATANDVLRLGMYLFFFRGDYTLEQPHWLFAGVLGALLGNFFGKSLIKSISQEHFELWISGTLILFALALGSGLLGQ